MQERSGYFFTLNYNPATKEIRTHASIPFDLMAKGIGVSLADLNLSDKEFNNFMFKLVSEYDLAETKKRNNNEQDEDEDNEDDY